MIVHSFLLTSNPPSGDPVCLRNHGRHFARSRLYFYSRLGLGCLDAMPRDERSQLVT